MTEIRKLRHSDDLFAVSGYTRKAGKQLIKDFCPRSIWIICQLENGSLSCGSRAGIL